MPKAAVPELNEPLIACVLRKIEEEPRSYNQNIWGRIKTTLRGRATMCGTTGCFAGWTVLLSTPVPQWLELHDLHNIDDQKVLGQDTPDIAAAKLGLTTSEARLLFSGTEHRSAKRNLAIVKRRLDIIRQHRAIGRTFSYDCFGKCGINHDVEES